MSISLTTTLLAGQNQASKQAVNVAKPSQSQAVPSSVTVGIESNPLTLAYQAAIDRINDTVAPYLGEDAIARGYESNIDITPQATADRIVSLSTALYSRYEAQRPTDDAETTVNQFVDTITGGIEQGFTEAKQILSSLGVLEGDIATNVELTFELTMQGVASFRSDALTNS